MPKRVAFKKLVALPRGKQYGIIGPVVNVPAHLENISVVLPRIPDNCHIIPLKFKRKLVYKGHYMHQFINPNKVMRAIEWLKSNNIHYEDTIVTNENEWKLIWNLENTSLSSLMPNEGCKLSPTTSISKMDTESCQAKPNNQQLNETQIMELPSPTLQQLTAAKQLSIVEVPGDGNCLFHAVNHHLQKEKICSGDTQMLRLKTVDYMETHPTHNGDTSTHFKIFITIETSVTSCSNHIMCENANSSDISWAMYLQKLRKGEWGDHLVIQALADMFDLAFSIVSTLTPYQDTIINPRHKNITTVFWLGHIGELHYTALEPSVLPIAASSPNPEIKPDSEQNLLHLNEDQDAFEESSQLRGLPFNTCLNKETITPDKTISIAPCEGAHPLPMLADTNFETMAFPTCYPTGINCISTDRKVRLTPRKYFNQRLLDVDGRFAKDIDYLFAAQYTVEEKGCHGSHQHCYA